MPKRHRPGASAASVVAHVEEIVLATSGEDAFEVVFALAASRLARTRERGSARVTPDAIRRGFAAVAKASPELAIARSFDVPDDVLVRVDELLGRAMADREATARTLDAVFESLVPRVAKGDKGQFFTPRHVVDFVIRALAPSARDVVVDPACGSGAFLAQARRAAAVRAFGCDVDARAVRVARLLSRLGDRGTTVVARGDGLGRETGLPEADVVATNPPFAGRAPHEGFEVARVVRSPERDTLFLERSLALLRPRGRLGIVLPYNKAAGDAYASLRRWLFERARVLAVVGLPRETFLPHTSQRTFVLFAKKRAKGEVVDPRERTLFAVSERAGKDTAGEPIVRGGELDHDLDSVSRRLVPFLAKEGFA